jgi:hypothetical protein
MKLAGGTFSAALRRRSLSPSERAVTGTDHQLAFAAESSAIHFSSCALFGETFIRLLRCSIGRL